MNKCQDAQTIHSKEKKSVGEPKVQEKVMEFQNPLAVIQAAVDLLNRDPDNKEKVLLACRIINQQASTISEALGQRLEESFMSKA